MLQRRRMAGLIFYGLSPMLRMSTKLGLRRIMNPYDVRIARDYLEAIPMARDILAAADGRIAHDQTGGKCSIENYRSSYGIQHTILRCDEWKVALEGLRIRFEVIDGHILHSIAEGSLKDTHLPHLTALREQVYGALCNPQGPHYMIADLQGLDHIERRARKYYQQALLDWHRKVPLCGYFVYGVNQFLAAVANFSRFIMPFEIRVFEDLDSALQRAWRETRSSPGRGHRDHYPSADGQGKLSDRPDPVEPLLEYIGGIDWERDGISLPEGLQENDALRPVYDAVSVIKSELDDLLHEKRTAEEALKAARDQLELRVRQRTSELVATNQRLKGEITERRETDAALRASEKNYRDLVESVNSIILRWDAEGRIVFMNPYGLAFFGYAADELMGKNVVGTIVPERESITKRDLKALMDDIRKDPDRFRSNENENRTRDGRLVWVYWTNRAITDAEGRIVEILSVGNDISGRRHMEAELRRLATTDPLTGAFNRRRFFQKARQEFLRHQRYGHPFAVLLMDLDHFKKINDTHGHPAGDAVLKAFVGTCQGIFRVTDIFGRTGGEEFSAILPETEVRDAACVAERLRDRVMNCRIDVGSDHAPICCTVSIGLTGLHENDVTLESMIRRADKALYKAKRAGRNCVLQF
jgi:diguanylate cyclase (GGDEF)-like protein/PAS domain S-box-containing protein